MTTAFDLVIRNADVATASDRFQCDIGIRDGKIEALGKRLPAGAEEIDATGLLVLPGGVHAHCHLDQPMPDGMRMASSSIPTPGDARGAFAVGAFDARTLAPEAYSSEGIGTLRRGDAVTRPGALSAAKRPADTLRRIQRLQRPTCCSAPTRLCRR